MSYPKDLDDYTEEDLNAELHKRQQLRRSLLCDYCGADPNTSPPCRYPERHRIVGQRFGLYVPSPTEPAPKIAVDVEVHAPSTKT